MHAHIPAHTTHTHTRTHTHTHTQAYTLRLIPQYFGIAFMTALQRVFQAEGWVQSNMVLCGLVCAVSPGLIWGCVHTLGWGYQGGAIAAGLFNSLYVFLQIPYLCIHGRGYLFTPHREALSLTGLREYVSLAGPGFFQNVLEWWALEIVLLRDQTRTLPKLTQTRG